MTTEENAQGPSTEESIEIDRICDEFDTAWKSSTNPRIEHFAERGPRRCRSHLLAELVRMDVAFRLRAGETPSLDSYLADLSEEYDAIRRSFELALTTHAHTSNRARSTLTGTTLGDFELLEEIGRGGMGVVYRARERSLNRIVAVKTIQLASEQRVQRFRSEVLSAAALSHPNIVSIHFVGEDKGRHYFSMDFVEGSSLADMVRSGPLPSREAAGLMATIADAVACAHESRIIHRDLKPANVLIDKNGSPKVADFGLAKNLGDDSNLTNTGQLLGTPCYMAPEQARGEGDRATPATDVHSLGGILYFLTTGRPPYLADTALETLNQVIQSNLVPPRRLNPSIARDLETICLKCLQGDPERRYASAAELASDLRRFMKHEPIHARSDGVVYRTRKFAARHRAAVAILLTVAISLLLTAVGFTAAIINARSAREMRRERLISNAIGLRSSVTPGRRFESLQCLSEAAALRPSLRIQNEAIASLPLVDLRVNTLFDADAGYGFTVAPDFGTYAYSDDVGNVSIHEVIDGELVRELPGDGKPAWRIQFSSEGTYLAARYAPFRTDGEDEREFRVWDVAKAKPIASLPHQISGEAWDFTPDGKFIALAKLHGPIEIWDLPGRKRIKQIPVDDWIGYIAYSPDGHFLALGSPSPPQAKILDVRSEHVVHVFSHEDDVRGLAWRRDGKRLATASGRRISVWDVERGNTCIDVVGHRNGAEWVTFNQTGDLLASYGWDGFVRLWDPWSGDLLIEEHGTDCILFSPDERRLAGLRRGSKPGLWDVASGRGFQVLRGHSENVATLSVDFHPKFEVLASANFDGVRIWDPTQSREPLAVITHKSSGFCRFLPDGEGLIATERFGLTCWPLHFLPDAHVLRVGNRGKRRLPSHAFANSFDLTPDGRLLVMRQAGANLVLVLDLKNPSEVRHLDESDDVASVAISPDGRYVVGVAWGKGFSRIWDVESGRIIGELETGNCSVTFTSDGRWLATGARSKYVFWEVGTWDSHQVLPRLASREIAPIAFAFGGAIAAIAETDREVTLIQTSTGEEVATLRAPGRDYLASFTFSSEGQKLAVSCEDGDIHVWRLNLLASELRDWEVTLTPLFLKYFGSKERSANPRLTTVETVAMNESRYPANFVCVEEPVIEWPATDHHSAHEWNEAISSLNREIEAAPRESRHHVERARVLASEAEWSEAADEFSTAIRLGNDDASVWFHWALVNLARENDEAYVSICQDMISRFQDSSEQGELRLLSWVCALTSDTLPDYELPLNIASREASAEGSYWARLRLGALLHRAGQFEDAADHLLNAVGLHPDGGCPIAHFFLAMNYLKLGDVAHARQSWQEASARVKQLDQGCFWANRVQHAVLERELSNLFSVVSLSPGS